jgi:hypothetical protein
MSGGAKRAVRPSPTPGAAQVGGYDLVWCGGPVKPPKGKAVPNPGHRCGSGGCATVGLLTPHPEDIYARWRSYGGVESKGVRPRAVSGPHQPRPHQ